MALIDIIVFVGFVATVIAVGLWKSRSVTAGESTAGDYFLAGRGLTWWLVGFSLIAANISTEQFVGMSGKAADWLGMAIASYEWMAAVTLVVVAFVFLPTFLRSGIFTIPEFLEYRYNRFARTIMAVSTMVILVGVPTASVIFAGAKVVSVFFAGHYVLGMDLGNITTACWIIGTLAALYVFAGGLKACAWADLIQGAALIVGGIVIAYLTMRVLGAAEPHALTSVNNGLDPSSLADEGAIRRFIHLNSGALPEGKLHMIRPANDPEIPWTALVVGLWIPNFFYWGLNQYITQRTLGSKSLNEGQKGIVFAAFLKLIIPFAVVVPGILAFNLYSGELASQADTKNNRIINQMADISPHGVLPFDMDFASLYPQRAVERLHQNMAAINEDINSMDLSPHDLVQHNNRAIQVAIDRHIPVGDALVGYDYDAAFPTLLRNVLPVGKGVLGFVLAAIFGAVISSLASMLNSASTIFTMDIFNQIRKDAQQKTLVMVGRICTVVFVLIAIVVAPSLGSPAFGGIFTFIQEFQGFISPGILAIFLFGLLVKRAPRMVGTVGLVLNPILYGTLKLTIPELGFLNRMAVCFAIVMAVLGIITVVRPLKMPITLPINHDMDLTTHTSTKIWGGGAVLLTIGLYIVFW